ncbi:hypothetical protein CALCODRAFT_558532 [Calocera cornea HHB12733]|uniref:Eisosome component PIL1-domain-containing protein n=1 Tax=Calocera cornea HHB12733 TaxID=1353952 RepID=A0A165CXE4_9BASI|nr:hypothetical protein CALCODRAFT_558532 [Calocera cornea HHB12733]
MSRFGVLGNLQTKIAHTTTIPALGNKDLRLLQEWISTEKGVVTSLLKLVGDIDRSNEALTHWGAGEGADLGDILSRSRDLLSHASIAFARFAEHEGAMRAMLKGIRTREEALDDAKKRRRSLVGKAEAAQRKLSKMGQENKQLPQQTELLSGLRHEIAQLDGFIYNEEAAIMDFKRRTTKDIMVLKFGGLAELAEKITIVGTLGKDLIEDIPLDATIPGQMRHPYGAFDKTRQTVEEAVRCVNSISFTATPAETLPPRRPEDWSQPSSAPPQVNAYHAQSPTVERPGPRYLGSPEISEPQPEQTVGSPQRPELPHHLPSNVGLPSPVDFSGSTGEWLATRPGGPQPKPMSPPPTSPGYSEFGQLSSPQSGRLAATFPIAAAHSRDPAYLASPGTVGGRPSSIAYLQDSTPASGGIASDIHQGDSLHPAPQPHAREDSQPPSVTGNPWKDETSPATAETQGTDSGPTSPVTVSPNAEGRRHRNRDDYHYEYSDSAFWVRNNMPATRSAERVDPVDSPKDEAPLDPPQAPAMFGMKNRSSSNLPGDRSPSADHEAPRLGVSPRPRIDVSPSPSQRSVPALGSGSPDGPRTIAAAAFKRTPRASSESFGDTPPLHVRKRGGPGVSGPDVTESPTDNGHHSPADGQYTPDDIPDEAPPVIPPVLTRYVQPAEEVPADAGVHGRRLPVPPSPGYNQGQFATELD